MMKKSLLAVLMIGLSSASFGNIAGSYIVSGWDPYNNKSYTGEATITEDGNNVYQAKWTILEGGETYTSIGTGMISKNVANFAYHENTGEIGLEQYSIKDDVLEGPFVVLKKNAVGNEKLKKKKFQ